MATEVQSIIDPDNGAGTDYTTLTAWESDNQGDIVSADEQHTALCRCSSGSALDDLVTVGGWTTDATRYVKITVDADYRHAGIYDASKFRIVPTSAGTLIMVTQEYTIVEYLQLLPDTSDAGDGIRLSTGSDYSKARFNIIDGQESSNLAGIIVLAGGNQVLNDNIIWGAQRSYFGGIKCNNSGALNIYNNTLYNNSFNIYGNASSHLAVNNACFDATSANFDGTFDTNSGYNATNDSSGAPGSNNQYSLTASDQFESLTGGSEDFRLKSTADLRGVGIGPSSDANVSTLDINGDTRSGSTTDIGADLYASGGATYTKSAGLDALIQKTGIAKTLSIDALLQSARNAECELDALISLVRSGQLSIDALLKIASGTTISIDALVQAAKSGTVSIDAFLKAVLSSSSQLDAIIMTALQRSADMDALLQKSGLTAGVEMDALVQAVIDKTISLDAILVTAGETSASLNLDALIQSIQSGSASIDALIAKAYSTQTALDAIVFALNFDSVSLDALIYRVRTGELSLDALIQISAGISIGFDALLYAAQTNVISMDAVLVLLSSSITGLDAIVYMAQNAGVGLDAILGALRVAARYSITPTKPIRTISPPARIKTLKPQ